jgi:O-methyltransferase family protein
MDRIEKENLIREMRTYAEEENVPIMQRDGINFLVEQIIKKDVKNILEIGTAIGYSTIIMAFIRDNIKITSVERDEKRYLKAVKNVKKAHLEDRINLIFNDALEVNIKDKYDLIFIDAAKAQNIKFFEKFKDNLNEKGLIITDNMNFHGLTEKEEEIKSRNLRALVRKIKNYRKYLEENTEFKTEFLNIGDGIAISKRV